MKKLLLTCALGALLPVLAVAASQDCVYSPQQTLVRDARNGEQIKRYLQNGLVFDETPRCGGTVMQLAIRRGNMDVLAVLLNDDLQRADQVVSLDDFPIPGAPRKIPLWLFAAYYAPNEGTIRYMKQALEQLGVSLAMTDDTGRNVLWYMERNPVLRKTELYDTLNEDLLTSLMTGNSQSALMESAAAANRKGATASKKGPIRGQLSESSVPRATLGGKDILEPTQAAGEEVKK